MSDFPALITGGGDLAAFLKANKPAVDAALDDAGALLFRGFDVPDAEAFDAAIEGYGEAGFTYEDSLSNAVRTNVTPRVFTANEAPPSTEIFLHHEMAQTPIYPSKLFFYCEIAEMTGGATPLCRSDWVIDRLTDEAPDFVARLEAEGVRYTNVMPGDDDAGSGQGRSWRSTLSVETKEEAEQRLSDLDYSWEWREDGSLKVTTAALPAVREVGRSRKTFFNQLIAAFRDISIDRELFENLGPAINSGAGLFLYGEPGNGKSTLARKITQCFGQQIWIPHSIYEDGQIIKLYDAAFHEVAGEETNSILKDAGFDRRWLKIKRPTVVVGGELTLDALEIRHDSRSNVSEASLQMKSNCGCLLIDDFGRQRIEPTELLNRWIVPLESRVDFLTLSSGKKIQVPFEQLIIFSTNLEPADLVDEAFLRRIPYKIEIGDPTPEEFHRLFQIYCPLFKCQYEQGIIDYLIKNHYEAKGRAMRRCHPRDLLGQIRNFCAYKDIPMEIRAEYFDRVVNSYFTIVIGSEGTETQATPAAAASS